MNERRLQPSFPTVDWEPLKEQPHTDRGLFADPKKNSLFSAATKVKQLTPTIGCEISGIDLRQLSDTQKDELFVFSLFPFIIFFKRLCVQCVTSRGTWCRLYIVALSYFTWGDWNCFNSFPSPSYQYSRAAGIGAILWPFAQTSYHPRSAWTRSRGSPWYVCLEL